MKFQIGMILLILSSVEVMASYPSVDSKMYFPKNVEDVSFKINSTVIDELLNTHFEKKDKYIFTVYKYQSTIDIDLGDMKGVPDNIASQLRKLVRAKVEIIFPNSFNKWLEVYEFEKKESDWYVYKDAIGVLDNNEIKVKLGQNELTIIEKKPVGTLRTKYDLMLRKWSDNKFVINRVERISYEGTQTVKVDTILKYSEVKEDQYLPVEIFSTTTQDLLKVKDGKVTREFSETFNISDYSINQESALKWFSKKK